MESGPLENSGRLPKGCPGRSQLSPRGSPASADRLLGLRDDSRLEVFADTITLTVVEEGRPYSHPLSRSSPDSHFPTRPTMSAVNKSETRARLSRTIPRRAQQRILRRAATPRPPSGSGTASQLAHPSAQNEAIRLAASAPAPGASLLCESTPRIHPGAPHLHLGHLGTDLELGCNLGIVSVTERELPACRFRGEELPRGK